MSNDPRTVVLIGKTGSGKSSLANTLLDSNAFAVGRGGRSVTKQCENYTAVVRNRQWTVVDTPGTRDINDKDGALNELVAAIKHCNTGIDAFLQTFRCDVRMAYDECKAIEESLDRFGPECFKRTIIIFSHGDVFNNDKDEFANELVEMRKEIPKLDEMMNRFGNRWLLMDNGKRCDSEVRERQLSDLEALVDSVAKLNSQRYSESDLKSDEKKLRKKHKNLKNEIALERKIHEMELKRLEDKHEAEKKRTEDKLQTRDQRTKDLIQAEKQRAEDMFQAQQRESDSRERQMHPVAIKMLLETQMHMAQTESNYQHREEFVTLRHSDIGEGIDRVPAFNIMVGKKHGQKMKDFKHTIVGLEKKMHEMELQRLQDKLERQKQLSDIELKLQKVRYEDKLEAQGQRYKDKLEFQQQVNEQRVESMKMNAYCMMLKLLQDHSNAMFDSRLQLERQERLAIMAAEESSREADSDDRLSVSGALAAIGEGVGKVLASPFAGVYKAFK